LILERKCNQHVYSSTVVQEGDVVKSFMQPLTNSSRRYFTGIATHWVCTPVPSSVESNLGPTSHHNIYRTPAGIRHYQYIDSGRTVHSKDLLSIMSIWILEQLSQLCSQHEEGVLLTNLVDSAHLDP
jgi:hypothetical protein